MAKKRSPAAYISFLLILLSAISTKAQDLDTILRHRLFFDDIFNHVDSRDEQASPLLYFGNGNPIGFGYVYTGRGYRHSLRLSFSASEVNANVLKPDLQDDAVGRKVFFTNGFLTYTYEHDWGEAMEGKLRYFLGAALDNVAFLRDYKYRGGDIYSSGGGVAWEELNMLSAAVRAEYNLNGSERIYTELFLPVISLVGRPGYNVLNTNSSVIAWSNFHIVLLGGLIGWNYSLAFEQKLWDALLLSASYRSRYYRYSWYGWTTSVLLQDVALELTWRFGL